MNTRRSFSRVRQLMRKALFAGRRLVFLGWQFFPPEDAVVAVPEQFVISCVGFVLKLVRSHRGHDYDQVAALLGRYGIVATAEDVCRLEDGAHAPSASMLSGLLAIFGASSRSVIALAADLQSRYGRPASESLRRIVETHQEMVSLDPAEFQRRRALERRERFSQDEWYSEGVELLREELDHVTRTCRDAKCRRAFEALRRVLIE